MAGRSTFGNTRKLPSGRWQASYWHEGEHHLGPHTFGTKADANAYLSTVQADVRRGAWIDPEAGLVKFDEHATAWLGTVVNLTPKSRLSIESLLRSTVMPAFADKTLVSIRPSAVREWIASLDARGLSASRIRQAHGVFSRIMASAVQDRLIVASPCVGMRLPRVRRPEPVYLTAEQVDELARAMPKPYDLFVHVLAYGGLRYGEAAALRRGRCHLLKRRLLIAEAMTEVSGKLIFGDPKSHQNRSVAVPASLTEELAAHLAADVARNPGALVFTAPGGGPLRYSNFRTRIWDPACDTTRLVGVTPHVLRHTCATLLLGQGASVKDVQAQLGHGTATLTLDTYAAYMSDHAEELSDRLDQLRTGATADPSRTIAHVGSGPRKPARDKA
ncbi:MAG: tyrosine-type recombinase/integrase [Acidimicrobiales bacterium]